LTQSDADGRDRDGLGRARNARPRDGLGRPLPYGSPNVERAPEGVRRTPAETLELAQQLLDSGRPFDAHEVLEDAWKSAAGPERGLWKALAQLAVAMTHEARGNQTGSATLLARGAAGLTAYRDSIAADARSREQLRHAVDVDGLIAWADAGGHGRPQLAACG
jgi:uncharacterized protein